MGIRTVWACLHDNGATFAPTRVRSLSFRREISHQCEFSHVNTPLINYTRSTLGYLTFGSQIFRCISPSKFEGFSHWGKGTEYERNVHDKHIVLKITRWSQLHVIHMQRCSWARLTYVEAFTVHNQPVLCNTGHTSTSIVKYWTYSWCDSYRLWKSWILSIFPKRIFFLPLSEGSNLGLSISAR